MSTPTGLFNGLKASGATLLDIIKTRLELLGNELQFEKSRILSQIGLGLALVFCAGVGVLLLVAFVTLVFWEQRLWVMGLACVLFLGLGLACLQALKRGLAPAQAPFAASVAELQKDIAALKQATQSVGSPPSKAP
jgi:uncharacterized membrane protein YqjE